LLEHVLYVFLLVMTSNLDSEVMFTDINFVK